MIKHTLLFFLSTENNPFIIFFLSSFIAPPLSHTNLQTHTHTKQKITFINKVSSLLRATTHVHKLFFPIENNYAAPFSCTNHCKSHLFKLLSRVATFLMTWTLQMTPRTLKKKINYIINPKMTRTILGNHWFQCISKFCPHIVSFHKRFNGYGVSHSTTCISQTKGFCSQPIQLHWQFNFQQTLWVKLWWCWVHVASWN